MSKVFVDDYRFFNSNTGDYLRAVATSKSSTPTLIELNGLEEAHASLVS